MIKFRGMETSDKQFFFASVIAPVIIWWVFTGSKRYGTGGMK
jgi:hypothetical protein